MSYDICIWDPYVFVIIPPFIVGWLSMMPKYVLNAPPCPAITSA